MAAIHANDIIGIIFLIVLIVLSCGSNFVVIKAILTYKKLRNAFNSLVVSLAVADLLVGVLVIPSYLIFLIRHKLQHGNHTVIYGVFLCLDIFTAIASIMNITLMSIDRALLFLSPTWHSRTTGNKSNAIKLISIPWLVAVFMIFPKIMQYLSLLAQDHLVLLYLFIVFIIPFVTIAFCYIYIFMMHARMQRRQNTDLKKDLNLAYMLLAIIIMFFICWGPFFGVMLYFSYCNPCKSLNGLAEFAKWMQFFHSCCNPFIYALLQPSLRKAFADILFKYMPCHLKNSQSTSMPNKEDTPTVEEFPLNTATIEDEV
eukprot:gene3405-3895_t